MAFAAKLRIHTHETELPLSVSKERRDPDSCVVVTDFLETASGTSQTWAHSFIPDLVLLIKKALPCALTNVQRNDLLEDLDVLLAYELRL